MWIDKPCHQLVLVTGQSWGAKQQLPCALRWKSSLVSLPLFPSSGALPCCVPKPVATAAPFLSSLSLLLDSPIPTTPLFFQSEITFFKNIKLPALPMSRPWKAEVCSLDFENQLRVAECCPDSAVGISQVLALSSVKAMEPAVEHSPSPKTVLLC